MNCWWPKTAGEKQNPGTQCQSHKRHHLGWPFHLPTTGAKSLNDESSLQFKLSAMAMIRCACVLVLSNALFHINLLYNQKPNICVFCFEHCLFVESRIWVGSNSIGPSSLTGEEGKGKSHSLRLKKKKKKKTRRALKIPRKKRLFSLRQQATQIKGGGNRSECGKSG